MTSEAGAFGALLRRYRQAAALSQVALAERAGISSLTVSALERGARRVPYLGTVGLLARALALNAAERGALLDAARPASDMAGQVSPSIAADVQVAITASAVPAPDGLAAALTPLVGRADELALLDHFLAGPDAPGAAARVLLLAGEPGIGKTRILQAAAQRAVPRGWCVLFGGCQRRGGEDPYAPLLAALAHHLDLLPLERRGAALAGCAWLVRLLPELAGVLQPLPAAGLAPEQERRLIHGAAARLLANVAGPAGTLLVLDDLQWAGPDALDLIDTLVRAATAPVRIVGAYRDTEVRPADPLSRLLADLAQARLITRRQLGPLAAGDAASLLEDLLMDAPEGGALVAEVLRRAGGTPFFLVSYAQALRQGSANEVPWDLAQGVRRRVALLPETAQVVLGTAAVVGRHVSRAVLAAAAGQPEEAVLAGLEAACRARLLLEEGDEAYVFAHDLIREVVEADLSTARRALLHRRVAETLEQEPSDVPPEVLAYHYARAGTQDRAVLYLERAGDHAWGQRAHGAADGHYREALTRLDRLGCVQDAARVREKLGEVLGVAGRYDAALAVLARAAETYAVEGDLEGQTRVTAAMGWAHRFRGTARAGLALVTALLERLEDGGASPPSLARLYQTLGWLLFTTGQYDAALAAGDRAAALARANGDDRTLALTETHRINLLQLLGRLNDALRAGQEVLPLVERIGDPTYLVGAHADLAYIHALQGAFSVGRVSLDRGLAWAELEGNPERLAWTLALRGWIATLSGEWAAVRADLDQAAAVLRQTSRSWYSAYIPIFQARAALAAGAWTAARGTLQVAIALAEGDGDLQALRWAAGTMAELEILEGRAESARDRLLPLLDRPGMEECDVTMLLPVLAWAHLELGQADAAAEAAEQALRRARPEGMRLVLVEALRVQALVALRRERWDEAARSLAEGLALARAMPYPYAEARLLHIDGLLYVRQGEPAVARERLAGAAAIYVRLGAQRDAEQLDQALAALSQNPAPSQNSPHAGEPSVSAAQWATIAALLPRPARTGRPRADDRRTLEAIMYQRRTGCPWARLPAVLGDGATAHRRRQKWQAAGLWERITAIVGTTPAVPEEPSADLRRDA